MHFYYFALGSYGVASDGSDDQCGALRTRKSVSPSHTSSHHTGLHAIQLMQSAFAFLLRNRSQLCTVARKSTYYVRAWTVYLKTLLRPYVLFHICIREEGTLQARCRVYRTTPRYLIHHLELATQPFVGFWFRLGPDLIPSDTPQL